MAFHGRLWYKEDMNLRAGMTMLVCLATLCGEAAQDFARYTVILDRKPFGEEVVPPPEAAAVVPPAESVVNKVKMTAVVRDEAGVLRVGIVDIKSNRNYMLGIGESLDGMEVVEADYEKERARLRRGVEDYWVSMYGGSNKFELATRDGAGEAKPESAGLKAGANGSAVPGVASLSAPVPGPSRSPVSRSRAALPGRKGELDQKLSYALRRMQREAARRRAEEAADDTAAGSTEWHGTNGLAGVRPGRTGATAGQNAEVALVMQSLTNQVELSEAEVAQLLQEYQKTLIRSGQSPLPIALTPETDAQLVEEGYLPPQ